MIIQCFKATEQSANDQDWLVGWEWTGLPHPRPQGRYSRGLSHAAEFAASISSLRETQVLMQYQANLRGQAGNADRANQQQQQGGWSPQKWIAVPKKKGDKGKGKGKDDAATAQP